jgi:hydroxymethylpyrimidine/phosphomethylpyrimidine kinase
MRTALTIAGSDSGGGAGIQADLKTFEAFGVFGTSAITAITAQNTLGVTAIHALDPELVAAQIDAIASDLGAHATKIGMLANAAIIGAVARALERHALPLIVLDPVMVAKGGDHLLEPAAVEALRTLLLPRATVLTPNVPEAEVLTGLTITSIDGLREAARCLVAMGARTVVVKGGHLVLSTGRAVDVWHDGHQFVELDAARIQTRHTHGTGCTFSSAVAAGLALGRAIDTSVRDAKAYITGALEHAPALGQGHGPVNHGWRHGRQRT